MIHCDIQIKEKIFSGNRVLNNLNLQINTNEFVSIVGPSGTGKSTLLNIVGGLDTEYSGHINFNKNLEDYKNISYVFQESRLMPWLSVYENIEIVLPKHINKPDKEKIITDLLINMNLYDYKNAFPNELSGGMQRRAGLARAFSVKPSLLLMDEPFVSLDLPTAKSLRQFLLSILEDYKPTILFVTHDLVEALILSDRVIFLSKKPAKIIHEVKLQHDSDMQERERAAKELYENLNNDYPSLLDGILNQALN